MQCHFITPFHPVARIISGINGIDPLQTYTMTCAALPVLALCFVIVNVFFEFQLSEIEVMGKLSFCV